MPKLQTGKRRRAAQGPPKLGERRQMYYVYILRSRTHPDETYIGSTHDLKRRLTEHNTGKSIHTNKFKPWNLTAYIALTEKGLAEKLERYLKSGSGRAFAGRHLQMQNERRS